MGEIKKEEQRIEEEVIRLMREEEREIEIEV